METPDCDTSRYASTSVIDDLDPNFADFVMNAQQLASGTHWKIGTFRGHDIRVSPFFLVLIGLFVFMGLNEFSRLPYQLMWAPVLFFSILLHELGHAAATKKCGFGTSKIILHGFGGVAISRRSHTKPKDGMFIALAGPAVTGLLAFGFLGALIGYGVFTGGESLTVLGHFLWLMVLANFFWLILNLLPIYPMDGGQTLMYFFRKKGAGQGTALVKTAKVSLVTIIITGLLAILVIPGGFLIFIIFAFMGYMNWQILQQAKGGGPGGPMMMRMPR